MRKIRYWAVFGIVIFALVVWNVVVQELGKEFVLEPEVRLPPYIPWGSNWHLRHREKTLMYEIKLEVENVDTAWLKAFERRVVENVCANPAMVSELRRGAVLEHEYLDRYSKWLASFVVRAGDCAR